MQVPGLKTVVPNIVHVVKIDAKPISRWSFLNILSIFNNIKPTALFVHCLSDPHGLYWEKLNEYLDIREKVVIVKIQEPIGAFNNFPQHPAHKSDCVRMHALTSMGGIYVDLDILILRSFDEIRNASITLGLQTFWDICNGVIIANKNSTLNKNVIPC